MLEIDRRASAAAYADDNDVRRLAPQSFDALEVNGQQCIKHRSLSLA